MVQESPYLNMWNDVKDLSCNGSFFQSESACVLVLMDLLSKMSEWVEQQPRVHLQMIVALSGKDQVGMHFNTSAQWRNSV